MPRKRLLKKWAKNAKNSMIPYRQAWSGGSKKLRRRRRAMNRLSRQIAREERKRVEQCRQVVSEIDAYQAKNELEKQNLVECRQKLTAVIQQYEEKIAFQKQLTDMQQQLKATQQHILTVGQLAGLECR